MSYHVSHLAPLLALVAACNTTPHSPAPAAPAPSAPDAAPPESDTPEKSREPKRPREPAKAICPPAVKGETDQQRIIRELDCLLEKK